MQFDSLEVLEEAVENGVGQSGLADGVVPHGDGQLAGEHSRT